MGDSVCLCVNCNPNQERGSHPPTADMSTILCCSCLAIPGCRIPTEQKFNVAEDQA